MQALETAPFTELPGWPKPAGGGCFWVEARDGAKLRAGLFQPDGPARGSVILSPGRTEPIEKYVEVIGELVARGFAVLVHDWRGQGLSARSAKNRLFGHARGWRPFITDYAHLMDVFEQALPKPWIGVGHSMGAGLTTLALAEGEDRLAAAVLSAPMLGVNTGQRGLGPVRKLSFLMNLAGRGKALVQPMPDPLDEMFETTILTHDKARWDRTKAQMIACPDLRLGGITWGWLAFALVLTDRVTVSKRIDTLEIPFVVVAAEKEKLVLNAASKAVAARAPRGSYQEVPGAYHEILMETDERRAVFWRAFDAVAEQVAPTPLVAANDEKPKKVRKKTSKAAAAEPPMRARSPETVEAQAPKPPRRAAAKSKPR